MAKVTFETEMPGLLTFSEAGEILGMTRTNIYNLVEVGRLHRISVGINAFVLRDEVEMLKSKRCPMCGCELVEEIKKEAEATTTPASQ